MRPLQRCLCNPSSVSNPRSRFFFDFFVSGCIYTLNLNFFDKLEEHVFFFLFFLFNSVMASKFVLVRETKGSTLEDLPGRPVALVRSQDPSMDLLVLCAVPSAEQKALSDSKERVEKEKAKGGKKSSSSTVPPTIPGMATKSHPRALSAAAMFEGDTNRNRNGSARVPFSIGPSPSPSKKARTTGGSGSSAHPHKADEESSDEDEREEKEDSSSDEDTKKKDSKSKVLASEAVDFVRLPMGSFFEVLPEMRPGKRLTNYIAGRADSGKSYYSANIIRRYKKLYPDNPVYGVCKTKLKDDPAYAELGIKQLAFDFFSSTEEEFDVLGSFGDKGCLVLFDDIDSALPEDLRNILAAIKDILNLGRKMNVSCMVTSHRLSNYMQTRDAIHESNFVTLFPKNELYHAIYYMCSKLGLRKEIIAGLKHKASRWITIHSAEPNFLLSETEAQMI